MTLRRFDLRRAGRDAWFALRAAPRGWVLAWGLTVAWSHGPVIGAIVWANLTMGGTTEAPEASLLSGLGFLAVPFLWVGLAPAVGRGLAAFALSAVRGAPDPRRLLAGFSVRALRYDPIWAVLQAVAIVAAAAVMFVPAAVGAALVKRSEIVPVYDERWGWVILFVGMAGILGLLALALFPLPFLQADGVLGPWRALRSAFLRTLRAWPALLALPVLGVTTLVVVDLHLEVAWPYWVTLVWSTVSVEVVLAAGAVIVAALFALAGLLHALLWLTLAAAHEQLGGAREVLLDHPARARTCALAARTGLSVPDLASALALPVDLVRDWTEGIEAPAWPPPPSARDVVADAWATFRAGGLTWTLPSLLGVTCVLVSTLLVLLLAGPEFFETAKAAHEGVLIERSPLASVGAWGIVTLPVLAVANAALLSWVMRAHAGFTLATVDRRPAVPELLQPLSGPREVVEELATLVVHAVALALLGIAISSVVLVPHLLLGPRPVADEHALHVAVFWETTQLSSFVWWWVGARLLAAPLVRAEHGWDTLDGMRRAWRLTRGRGLWVGVLQGLTLVTLVPALPAYAAIRFLVGSLAPYGPWTMAGLLLLSNGVFVVDVVVGVGLSSSLLGTWYRHLDGWQRDRAVRLREAGLDGAEVARLFGVPEDAVDGWMGGPAADLAAPGVDEGGPVEEAEEVEPLTVTRTGTSNP